MEPGISHYGLLRGSFVPPQAQRDLRDLTCQRIKLVRERASVINRLQKVLEGANIKLASVVTDVLGVSACAMLDALLAGTASPGARRAARMQWQPGGTVPGARPDWVSNSRWSLVPYSVHIAFYCSISHLLRCE
jgi:hypothetical protein